LEAQNIHDRKWASIAKLVSGRTALDCSNRFKSRSKGAFGLEKTKARAEEKANEVHYSSACAQRSLACSSLVTDVPYYDYYISRKLSLKASQKCVCVCVCVCV